MYQRHCRGDFMKTEKTFLKRRLEEAIFHWWILKKYSEKKPSDTFGVNLAEDYRKKYEYLMNEYLRLFGEDYQNDGYTWSDTCEK